MNPSATLEQVLDSPEFPVVLGELAGVLELERAARERFYDEVTGAEKAEFINGKVLVHSPAKYKHTRIIQNVVPLLDHFCRKHLLGVVLSEKALVALTRNDYEPDVVFLEREKARELTPETLKFPAPDLAVEVLSESTRRNDRGVKFRDYALHGVREYWIIDPDDETIEQYELSGSEYVLRVKLAEGILRSLAVEGFAMPVSAIFDSEENRKALRAILL